MTNDNESAVRRVTFVEREGRSSREWGCGGMSGGLAAGDRASRRRGWWCVALRSVLIKRYYLLQTRIGLLCTVLSHNHVARLVACPPIYLATCLPDEVLYEGHSAEQAA